MHEMTRGAIQVPSADPEPLAGNTKVTRHDWLRVALETLVQDGVELVKVLVLADRLGVSRSSFYWYFKSRQDLLDQLLQHWMSTNTAALVAQADRDSATITEAVLNVFLCVYDDSIFDTHLDFAIRDWARRSESVRQKLHRSDTERLAALSRMFQRHGYSGLDATTRARILYYMQIGYDDAMLNEPLEARLELVPFYLEGFTGRQAIAREVDAFRDRVRHLRTGDV